MEEIKNGTSLIEDASLGNGNQYRPIEEEIQLQEFYLNHQDKLIYGNRDEIEVYGTEEQRTEMFKDFAAYTGEITNPDTSAANTFFKKADGKASLYAPLDEVLNTTRPVLSKHGFGIFQSPVAKTGQVTVKTLLVHKSGGSISFPALTLPIAKNDAQGVIAGITYARRAALNPILATHGETDDDGNEAAGNNKPTQSKKSDTKPVAPQNVIDKQKQIVALCKELISAGTDRDVVNTTLKNSCGSVNPNSVVDTNMLEKAYTTLDEIRNGDKEEK